MTRTGILVYLLALRQLSSAGDSLSTVSCTTDYDSRCHNSARLSTYYDRVTDVHYDRRTYYTSITVTQPPVTSYEEYEVCKTIFHTVTLPACTVTESTTTTTTQVPISKRDEEHHEDHGGDGTSIRRTRSRHGDCATAVNCRTTYFDHSVVRVTHVDTVTLPPSTVYRKTTDTLELHSTITIQPTVTVPPFPATTTTTTTVPPVPACFALRSGTAYATLVNTDFGPAPMAMQLSASKDSADVFGINLAVDQLERVRDGYYAFQNPFTTTPQQARGGRTELFFDDPNFTVRTPRPVCRLIPGSNALDCIEADGRNTFQICAFPTGDGVGLDIGRSMEFGNSCVLTTLTAEERVCGRPDPVCFALSVATSFPDDNTIDGQYLNLADDGLGVGGKVVRLGPRTRGETFRLPNQSGGFWNSTTFAGYSAYQENGENVIMFNVDDVVTDMAQRPSCRIEPATQNFSCREPDGRMVFEYCPGAEGQGLRPYVGLVFLGQVEQGCFTITLRAESRQPCATS